MEYIEYKLIIKKRQAEEYLPFKKHIKHYKLLNTDVTEFEFGTDKSIYLLMLNYICLVTCFIYS